MSDKLKRYQALRQTELKKLKDLSDISEQVARGIDTAIPVFKCMFLNIENIRSAFYDNHNSVVGLTSGDDSQFEVEDAVRKNFDSKYYAIKVVHFQLPSEPVVQASPNITSNQLPKINLPTFSGDITAFQSFIDLYDALIHNNATLANCEKFTYLLSSVKGSALAVIQHIPVTSSNYAIAYDTMCKRFKNIRLMASTLWNNLENAPKVTGENPTDLRNLLDIFSENIAALKNLGLPTDYWDFILVQMILKRLDISIVTRFELFYDDSTVLPTYKTLSEFLAKNCTALDNINLPNNLPLPTNKPRPRNSNPPKPSGRFTSLLVQTPPVDRKCPICDKNDHVIFKCPDFLAKPPYDRYKFAKCNKYCINCLSHSHRFAECQSKTTCHKCDQRHHTLLHFSKDSSLSNNASLPPNNANTSTSHPNRPSLQGGFTYSKSNILLSTARIEILDSRGTYQPLRCLLDSGSMTSFITSKGVKRLGLHPVQSPVNLNGLGPMQASVNQGVTLSFRPLHKSEPIFTIDALILTKICENLPTFHLPVESWPHLSNLRLADERFNYPDSIDLLLGADIFSKLLLDGRIPGGPGQPDAINTVFGYILMGNIQYSSGVPSLTAMFCHVDDAMSLEKQVKHFWELEEVPQVKFLSPDEAQCEKIYMDSYKRLDSGRFVVKLPFREEHLTFPSMHSLALYRFYSLERRLVKNPQIYDQYRKFIQEFLDLGHMEPISGFIPQSFYLPHHCVIKPESLTTKLRVVFNGSAHLPQQPSLNDQLFMGPKLQSDIVTILLHFRLHKYVLTADISKMYRQIIVAPEHRDYQRILWRFSITEPVQQFRINRLVYGLTCSPYLAIRTLLQLAEEDGASYPLAADALRSSTYVDDIVTGSSSLESALALQRQLISLLLKGGFELQKWSSNSPELLSQLQSSQLAIDPVNFNSSSSPESSLKILGLEWNASADCFRFRVEFPNKPCTKRNLLSNLARIFDPLGIISPITFLLKHLIQQLWTLNLGWDQEPPPEIVKVWNKYVSDLVCLRSFQLPRLVLPDRPVRNEIHCFGDASEKGFCSVLYFRCFLASGEVSVQFICSKTKIAPLKRVSLPRLELCASVLTARLVSFGLKAFEGRLDFHKVYCYSDSTVALSWIKSSPHKWRTFVSNRVALIQEKIPLHYWHYISSADNPADVGSRGMLPSELLQCSLWWAAPVLANPDFPSTTPMELFANAEVTQEQRLTVCTTSISPNFLDTLLEVHSSFPSSIRILAYMLRFIKQCQSKIHNAPLPVGPLTSMELYNSLLVVVRRIQMLHFSEEIKLLQHGKNLSKTFRKLSPFLDDHGILRVGGRLRRAPIHFDRKFPALLPSRSRLTDLIIESTHLQYLHAGIQTVHCLVLHRFWILSAKRSIRRVLSRCIRCWKTNPTSRAPAMGDLPLPRVSRHKPFLHVGIDYAGPFTITMSKSRGSKTLKAYLCIFICLSIKAVHLELASDLSADAFLAAFKRFVSRRGRCEHIYSDCGTNFGKARKILDKYAAEAATKQAVTFHFNPPSSPHFGGLWESNIKSIKTHLTRVIGLHILTYEELYTVLTQIEAILNSRPLTPISNDPNDLQALTPGHFLTGEPLTAPPEPNLQDVSINRLSRWQLLTHMQQHIWSRWSNEYLHTLHQRTKWHTSSPNLKPGTLVAIKQDMTPPLQWPLARIVATHPGTDGTVRVVTVKTAGGILKRPAIKLCPLPLET